jgi:hypothetical protein
VGHHLHLGQQQERELRLGLGQQELRLGLGKQELRLGLGFFFGFYKSRKRKLHYHDARSNAIALVKVARPRCRALAFVSCCPTLVWAWAVGASPSPWAGEVAGGPGGAWPGGAPP